MEGRDTLALLPTGGGKSICFQVPALCMEGICLVVSPLVALMYDQVNNLKQRKIEAYAITSALHPKEIDRILDNCVYGHVKFLYVSPERLQNELFLARFKKMKLCMIAVDEAHCISQWGYDFRPPYLQIAEIRPLKPEVPVLALTASATPLVVNDIQKRLAFKETHVLATSFARPNLSYNVAHTEDKEGKLLEICSKLKGSGIVYCGTRHETKTTALFLNQNGMSAAYYHAGLSNEERDSAYKKWFKNEARIMCATNAFGMGIDKPDVRFVVHTSVPAHPEAYFQEAGRGGRDGLQAFGILLYNEEDIEKLHDQIEQKFPPKKDIQHVYKCLANHLQIALGAGQDVAFPFNIPAFCKKYNLPLASTMYSFKLLELANYLTVTESAFLPSRIMFLVNKQELYSYQVANIGMDAFIKVLLRTYGGLFEQYTSIREEEVALNAKLDLRSTMEKLRLLKLHNIISYEQHTDDPKITLLTGRMNEEQLLFAPEVYEWRKKSELERAEAMRRFIQRHKCRSIQLLEYFGEKNLEPCGRCDVCRSNKKHGLSPEEYEKIHEAVLELILHKEFTIEELPAALPQFNREHLIEYARWKLDIGELILNDKLCIALPNFG
jgi:ATP-dependent DNA helicase RecQ